MWLKLFLQVIIKIKKYFIGKIIGIYEKFIDNSLRNFHSKRTILFIYFIKINNAIVFHLLLFKLV